MCSESHLSKSRSIDKRLEKTRYYFSSQKAGDCSWVFCFWVHHIPLPDSQEQAQAEQFWGGNLCPFLTKATEQGGGVCNISSSFPLHSVLREKHGRMAEGILVSTIRPSCKSHCPSLNWLPPTLDNVSIILKFFLTVLMGIPFDSLTWCPCCCL